MTEENTMLDETVEENPENVAIAAAFEAGIAAGKEEEEIKLDMIEAGAKFKNVTRLYNGFAVDAGLIMTKKEKNEIVSGVLDGLDLADQEAFKSAVAQLVESVKDTSEKSAAALIRAYGKKHDLEVYKAPKASKGGTRTTFTGDYYDALLENPKMTEEQAHEIIVEKGTPNTLRWEKTHQKVRQLVNDIAAKYSL